MTTKLKPNPREARLSKPIRRLLKKLQVDNLWLWILRLLLDDEKYAYELKNEIEERFGFAPATVTNYAVLYKLEREGLVTTVQKTMFPNRKYYQITPYGREVFLEAKKAFEGINASLFEDLE